VYLKWSVILGSRSGCVEDEEGIADGNEAALLWKEREQEIKSHL
jgi:hypothetical protein